MADNENSTDTPEPEIDIDKSIDRRQRWPYLIFGVIALCVIIALARLLLQ